MTKRPVLDSITGGPPLDEDSNLTPQASLPAAQPVVNGAERLTTSPFHIDHEAEARAKIIAQLREDAHHMDASAASLRILGNHTRADTATDHARALRVAAQHLAAADSVP